MPREQIWSGTIEGAVRQIIPYLLDMSSTAHKTIYFDGWSGLAASAVLRTIAEDPPLSLRKKFNKIIHVDSSRWKSRRSLQKTITQELNLPRQVMDIFDRQDEEDDFRGVVESSRTEIGDVSEEILRFLLGYKCLVVFHNGSNDMVNLSSFGIPEPNFFGTNILWTFRGMLRMKPTISEKVDNSHLFLYSKWWSDRKWNYLLQNEAREIARYTDNLGDIVEACCLYLLSLNSRVGDIMDCDWVTHASSYWVCDGIIHGGQSDEAWKVAAALHQQIHMEDYSSNALTFVGGVLETPPKRWIFSMDNSVVHPESTSFFHAAVANKSDPPFGPLSNDIFHQSDNLRVLKLCRCSFNFSSPPFHCCHNLRFLGLDSCKDQQVEEVRIQDIPTMDFFKSLWVLEICYTEWELDLPVEIIEWMSANIREVHIKKGRIWRHSFTWRELQNLRKLRIIEPTSPWETGEKNEFTDMVNLEFLDLSGDSRIQALPSMSGATSLKILVLDGCVGLQRVGPEGLPPSLESFSLDCCTSRDSNKEAEISHISLAGCARLVNFRLCGSLPNLQDLDLSGTLVKTLDLKDQVVQAPNLHQIILLGCLQLLAILWPENGMPKHTVLRIDSSVCRVQVELHQAYATIMDIRFLQTLILESNVEFCWKSARFHLNLCFPCTNKVQEQSYKDKTAIGISGQIIGPPRPKLVIPNTYMTFTDVIVDNITIDHDYNIASRFQPLDSHVEIGDGISFARMESTRGKNAFFFVVDKVDSLHVHDNSSITTVIPEHMMAIGGNKLGWKNLKQCHVVRCPMMQTVFTTDYDAATTYFQEIETFWAADLLMARCIWSTGRTFIDKDITSFGKLRSIQLYSCPRLAFVLPLLWSISGPYLPNLESLHIVNCGDLTMVFPVHPNLEEGVLEFPSLKHIHLYELYKLQHICEVKMLAPKLERVWLRGCWGLRRLPAVGRDGRPIVDCEKDWWEKLEWDGLEAGHHPSLFEPRHSSYYKMPLERVSVLR